jgi:hypothetical protein
VTLARHGSYKSELQAAVTPDNAGRLVVVSTDNETQGTVRANASPYRGPAGPVQTLDVDTRGEPVAASAKNGEVVAAWFRSAGSELRSVLRASIRRPGGGFGAARDVARFDHNYVLRGAPGLAAGPDGTAVLWWGVETAVGEGIRTTHFVSVRKPGGTFGPAQRVAEGRTPGLGSSPKTTGSAVVSRSGLVTYAWTQSDPAPGTYFVSGRRGPVGPAKRVSGVVVGSAPELIANGRGDVVMTMSGGIPRTRSLGVAVFTRKAGARTFTRSPAMRASSYAADIASDGTVVVGLQTGNRTIKALRFPAGRRPGRAKTLTSGLRGRTVDSVSVAVKNRKRALVAWLRQVSETRASVDAALYR